MKRSVLNTTNSAVEQGTPMLEVEVGAVTPSEDPTTLTTIKLRYAISNSIGLKLNLVGKRNLIIPENREYHLKNSRE